MPWFPAPSSASTPQPTPRSRTSVIRRHLIRMVLWVLAIDVVAITVYYVAHLSRADERTRMVFTFTWSIVTIVVVLTALRRIRIARRGR